MKYVLATVGLAACLASTSTQLGIFAIVLVFQLLNGGLASRLLVRSRKHDRVRRCGEDRPGHRRRAGERILADPLVFGIRHPWASGYSDERF